MHIKIIRNREESQAKKKRIQIVWFHLYKILINTKDAVTDVGEKLPRARWES